MRERLINGISESLEQGKNIEGYSNSEIHKIEKLYDIHVTGQFKDFLLRMGRCEGGVFGDDPIILFRSLWSVRDQILFQIRFLENLKQGNFFDYLKLKPFAFSLDFETQYYFLLTKDENPDLVYRYDENEEAVINTEWSLDEYLVWLMENDQTRNRKVCCGELLIIN